MKTKAAILFEQNKPLLVDELIVPELIEGQVLVKVISSGVCRSQLNEIKGMRGPDKYLPHTLGHEGAGIVEAVGPNVKKVKKGDHVVLSWIRGKGINAVPPLYYNDSGKINSGQLSTFNEYTVTAENRVTPIDKRMPFNRAALLGCAAATGLGVVMNDANIKAGESIVVFGVGGIGLLAVQAAAIRMASTIIAVDINEIKLNSAKEFGATHTINPEKSDVVSEIFDISNSSGVDYAIESAGKKMTMEQAFQSVRKNGGKVILIGNLPHKQQILIDPFDLIYGKQIIGSWGGGTDPERDFPVYVDLYLQGKLNLDNMISNTYSLDKINEAISDFDSGKTLRPIIDMEK